jgi:hypothetical protein
MFYVIYGSGNSYYDLENVCEMFIDRYDHTAVYPTPGEAITDAMWRIENCSWIDTYVLVQHGWKGRIVNRTNSLIPVSPDIILEPEESVLTNGTIKVVKEDTPGT